MAANNRLQVLSRHLGSGDEIRLATSSEASTPEAGVPVVMGAMILDIQAQPSERDLEHGGSVPGSVRQTPGGVGRNVAQGLAQLCRGNSQVLLISVTGDDAAGSMLRSHWGALGQPTHGILQVAGTSTPSVVCLLSPGGDVAAEVADVHTVEQKFTPELVRRFRPELRRAPIVMLDGNLPATVLEEACSCIDQYSTQIWFEPVSSAKATRPVAVLERIAYASPNVRELLAMSDAVRMRRRLPQLARPSTALDEEGVGREALMAISPHLYVVLKAGVRHIFLTLGQHGAAHCRLSEDGQAVVVSGMPALPARVVNTSGAGDCLVAGALMRLLDGGDPASALAHGLAAARCAVESSSNVPLSLQRQRVRQDAQTALSTLFTWSIPCHHEA